MDRRPIALVGGAVIVAVLLVAIGVAIGDRPYSQPSTRQIAPEATESAAVQAATDVIITMLDGDTLAAPEPRAVMADRLSPALLDRWEALATQAVADVVEPLGGTLSITGRLAAIRTWALSTRVSHFDSDGSATVQIWTLTIAEGAMKPDSPRTLGWRTATVDLAWTEAGWVAVDVNFAGGPVPGGDPQTPSSPASVVRAALGEPWS